ncbi:MAG: FAD-dependent oxidoreductase, partial [Verrucomicrobium sp.]
VLKFGDDLKQNLDNADNVAESIKNTIDKYIEGRGIDAPQEDRYKPLWEPTQLSLEIDYQAEGIRSIIWSMGYQTDYRWMEIPVFDGKGYPSHQRGVTTVPGVYFLGLPWQYTWGSGRFSGVADDAKFLADAIDARNNSTKAVVSRKLNELALGS